jgi:hypothetical protein
MRTGAFLSALRCCAIAFIFSPYTKILDSQFRDLVFERLTLCLTLSALQAKAVAFLWWG